MSTTAITVQAPPVSRSIPAIYATATAITVSAVSAAPTPIYRFYRETLGLTPFTITLIVAVYAFTMIAAFLTIARLSRSCVRACRFLARSRQATCHCVLRRAIASTTETKKMLHEKRRMTSVG